MSRADRSFYADVVSTCELHGEFSGIICRPCHEAKALEIDRVAAELRVQRTPDFMRREVSRLRAEGNGVQTGRPA